MSFLYDRTEQLLEDLSNLTIAVIVLLAIALIFMIKIIFSLDELNKNIKDIRKITIKDYNEKHPDDKFREKEPYGGTEYNKMLH